MLAVKSWRWMALASCFLLLGATRDPPVFGGDWPQILGPHRDGVAVSEKLREQWPTGGPQKSWEFPLGMGYAGPAVAGERVVIFHRVGANERVEALDLATGKSLWKQDFPARYRGGIDSDLGPRCVPVIDGQRIFVYGAAGDMHALELATGKTVWSRTLSTDYQAPDGYFGAGSTPLVIGDKLLVNVGGKDGSGLVALARETGRTLWKGTSDAASYSSPTVLPLGDSPRALFVTRLHVVCVDPQDGHEIFRFPFGQRGPTVNAATPLVWGNHLFVTASYGIGAVYARFDDQSSEPEWANDDALSSQYATPVLYEGFLYGTHGREDQGRAAFRCIEVATGRVRWSENDFGVCNVILAGDKLLMLSSDGKLVLARAQPEEFSPLATAKVSAGVTRALPALAHGKLFFRENDGARGQLKCLVVGE